VLILGRKAPLFSLLFVAIGHALPVLLNAHELHSDAAVVGLQARHLLRGEWSWFLWGSGYQTSTDSLIAALLFLALGPTPLALTLSAFLGHLVLVALAFATLRRRFDAWPSALLASPLVLATGPLHTYMFSPPRQASLTLVFASIWLLDGAPRWQRPKSGLALGCFVASLACFADPYALIFLPALALFLVLNAAELPARQRAFGVAGGMLAGLVGLTPFWLISHSQHASPGVLGLRMELVRHNLTLLWQVCLPYLLGTTVYYSPGAPLIEVWQAPAWFYLIQLSGACILLVGIALGGASFLTRRVPFTVRRLALLGAVMLPITLAAFAISVMVMDRLSARYLVAIVLMAPFALAPLLSWLGPPRFALVLVPWLATSAVAGWLGYGDDVDGFRPVHHSAAESDEVRLRDLLGKRGLSFAIADYWVSYRLTFLFDEDVVVVPWHEELDRYPAYRKAFALQDRVAYIYDPWRSKEDVSKRATQIEAGETDFSGKFETVRVGRYTVLVLQRARRTRPLSRLLWLSPEGSALSSSASLLPEPG
jgi:hypothetical protein